MMNGLKKYLIGVAVTITCALLLQSLTLIWWGGGISSRMNTVEQRLDRWWVVVHDLKAAEHER